MKEGHDRRSVTHQVLRLAHQTSQLVTDLLERRNVLVEEEVLVVLVISVVA